LLAVLYVRALPREVVEALAREAAEAPLVEDGRSEAFVQLDGVPVPVENDPLSSLWKRQCRYVEPARTSCGEALHAKEEAER